MKNPYAGALAKFNSSYNPETYGAQTVGGGNPLLGILGGAAGGMGNMMKNPYFAKLMADKLKAYQGGATQAPAPVADAMINPVQQMPLPEMIPLNGVAQSMPITMPEMPIITPLG